MDSTRATVETICELLKRLDRAELERLAVAAREGKNLKEARKIALLFELKRTV